MPRSQLAHTTRLASSLGRGSVGGVPAVAVDATGAGAGRACTGDRLDDCGCSAACGLVAALKPHIPRRPHTGARVGIAPSCDGAVVYNTGAVDTHTPL